MTIFLNLKIAHLQIPPSQISLLTFLPLWYLVSSRAWNFHTFHFLVHQYPVYSVWGCVRRLEACGFKVVALICDGASANHNFLKLHKSSNWLTYKTESICQWRSSHFLYIRPPSFDRKYAELLGKCTVIVAQEIFWWMYNLFAGLSGIRWSQFYNREQLWVGTGVYA